jgi:hypothetical protein
VTPPWAAAPVAPPEDGGLDAGGALLADALDAGADALADGAATAGALDAATGALAAADADVGLVLAVVLELLQADAARAMMPTAATPVRDLRNMETFRMGRHLTADDRR